MKWMVKIFSVLLFCASMAEAHRLNLGIEEGIELGKSVLKVDVYFKKGAPCVGCEVILREGEKDQLRARTDQNGKAQLLWSKPSTIEVIAQDLTGHRKSEILRVFTDSVSPETAKGQMGESGAQGGGVDQPSLDTGAVADALRKHQGDPVENPFITLLHSLGLGDLETLWKDLLPVVVLLGCIILVVFLRAKVKRRTKKGDERSGEKSIKDLEDEDE